MIRIILTVKYHNSFQLYRNFIFIKWLCHLYADLWMLCQTKIQNGRFQLILSDCDCCAQFLNKLFDTTHRAQNTESCISWISNGWKVTQHNIRIVYFEKPLIKIESNQSSKSSRCFDLTKEITMIWDNFLFF